MTPSDFFSRHQNARRIYESLHVFGSARELGLYDAASGMVVAGTEYRRIEHLGYGLCVLERDPSGGGKGNDLYDAHVQKIVLRKYHTFDMIGERLLRVWRRLPDAPAGCGLVEINMVLEGDPVTWLLPLEYANISRLHESLFVVTQRQETELFQGVYSTRALNLVVPVQYSAVVARVSDTLFIVRSAEGQYGLHDTNMPVMALAAVHEDICRMEGDFLLLKKREQIAVFNAANDSRELVVPYGFDDIAYVNPTLFAVRKGDEWGLYDTTSHSLLLLNQQQQA